MKRTEWEKKVKKAKKALRSVLKLNKRDTFGECPACGAERFQVHTEDCLVFQISELLDATVDGGAE